MQDSQQRFLQKVQKEILKDKSSNNVQEKTPRIARSPWLDVHRPASKFRIQHGSWISWDIQIFPRLPLTPKRGWRYDGGPPKT